MSNLKHLVHFEQGYDCIKFECVCDSKDCKPGAGGSHGVHGLQIRFVSKGKDGAVQFLIYTDWLPKKVEKSEYSILMSWAGEHRFGPMPADLGYHSKEPHYPDQTPQEESCIFCDNQPCYYDGSGLNATDAMYTLVNGGDEALFQFLDDYYRYVFEGGEYPSVVDYPKELRK